MTSEREPAWKRVTEGEPRWIAALFIAAAIGLQYYLPNRLHLLSRYFLPSIELVLLLVLVASNPFRITKTSKRTRYLSLSLIGLASVANAYSVLSLIRELLDGDKSLTAYTLLGQGGAIYLTNIIIFGLWYWEMDRGGPGERALATKPYPDFLFPQMTTDHVSDPNWEPGIADYMYVSFTNATAFSPTDTMPLSQWSKMIMAFQSAVALVTVALVVARAINILQ